MVNYPIRLRYVPPMWSLDVTETGSEPLTVAQLKAQVREDGDDEDALLGSYAKTARQVVEGMTGRAIVTQTRVLRMSRFPFSDRQYIELPGGYVQSVSNITYVDANGSSQNFTAYEADLSSADGTGRLWLARNGEWPDVEDRALPVAITYVAGYAPDASPAIPVPERLLDAMRLVFADLYAVREAQTVEDYSPNRTVRLLTEPMRVWSIG